MSVLSVVIPFSFSEDQETIVELAQLLVERVPGLLLPTGLDLDKSVNSAQDCVQQLQSLIEGYAGHGYRRILILAESYDNYSHVSKAIDQAEQACGQLGQDWSVSFVATEHFLTEDLTNPRHLERTIQRVCQPVVYMEDTTVYANSSVT